MSAAVLLRFMAKVSPEPTSGCWLWAAALDERGYGRFGVDGRNRHAHRVSWELHVGPIGVGKFICHRCDHPACVNPRHLFEGTADDNMRDMVAKGRSLHRFGDANTNAKLSHEKAGVIRQRFDVVRNASQLAREFGVSEFAIRCVLEGRTWRPNVAG